MPEPAGGADQPKLAFPSPVVWRRLGLIPGAEVQAGYQSRVFRATGEAGQLVVKLIERTRDDAVTRQRIEVNRQLAEVNPAVVGPVPLGSNLVTDVDAWQAVCYPFVQGRSPDTDDRHDVEAIAATLATLHDSLSTLKDAKLPPVAAVQDLKDDRMSRGQLIHGDYAAANLIVTSAGLKVIDFADCGQGSVEFEIGNSLYMALFDSWHNGDLDRYDRFRSWFVDEYRSCAPMPVYEGLMDRAIQIRTMALEQWLAHPSEAPTGIRTASTDWRRRLQSFVNEVSGTR